VQPGIWILAIPTGFLAALLIVYGRLSADGELMAIESCGFSIWGLVWPMIVVSVLLSLFMVIFMDVLLPWGNVSYLKLDYKVMTEKASMIVKERIFMNAFEGYTLHVDRKDDAHNVLNDVKVLVFKDNDKEKKDPYRVVWADRGVLRQDPNNFHAILDLGEGRMQQNGAKKNERDFEQLFEMKFKSCSLDLSVNQMHNGPIDFRDPRNISMRELATDIREKKNKNQDVRYAESEFHKKISLPFSALAFAFIGIPLGLTVRKGSLAGYFYAVLLAAIYYYFIMFGDTAGPMGVIPPSVAMWLPNAVLIVLGMVLVYRLVHKHDFWKNPFRKTGYPSDNIENSIQSTDINPE
jgi:lipopolysaccharide export system permease protein